MLEVVRLVGLQRRNQLSPVSDNQGPPPYTESGNASERMGKVTKVASEQPASTAPYRSLAHLQQRPTIAAARLVPSSSSGYAALEQSLLEGHDVCGEEAPQLVERVLQ